MRLPKSRFKGRWRTPEHYQEGMKNYYALMTEVDSACEKIVNELKARGLYNKTMIIFTTDNGLFHGAHGIGGKWMPYQESIRVPLIIYDPRMPQEKRGTLDHSFTLNVDLAETILGAAGLKKDPLMQGRDIADLYLQDGDALVEPWRNEYFYEYPNGTGGARPKSTALVRKDFKYIYWEDFAIEQLYNLEEDPQELEDVFDRPENQAIIEEMRARHDQLKREVFEPCTRKDPKCDPFIYEDFR